MVDRRSIAVDTQYAIALGLPRGEMLARGGHHRLGDRLLDRGVTRGIEQRTHRERHVRRRIGGLRPRARDRRQQRSSRTLVLNMAELRREFCHIVPTWPQKPVTRPPLRTSGCLSFSPGRADGPMTRSVRGSQNDRSESAEHFEDAAAIRILLGGDERRQPSQPVQTRPLRRSCRPRAFQHLTSVTRGRHSIFDRASSRPRRPRRRSISHDHHTT